MTLSIVTIGAFVATLNQGTKYIATNFIKRDISKWIPVFSVIYGIILGIIGFYVPEANMGSSLVEAIFIGIAAGSGSTGIHQIIKQHTKETPEESATIAKLIELQSSINDVINRIDITEKNNSSTDATITTDKNNDTEN